jgi:hypothetical protein
MGLIHKIFMATPDELDLMVKDIQSYRKRTEEMLVKQLEQSKNIQSTMINILKTENKQ